MLFEDVVYLLFQFEFLFFQISHPLVLGINVILIEFGTIIWSI